MISIRKADRNDAQAAWGLRNAAINSQCTSYYPPESLRIWTEGEMTEQFVTTVADRFYVATLDDNVVGTGMIDLESGKVDAIFVHPSKMRNGVGRQILSHLENLALEAGLDHVSLESTLNASTFYRACGYVGETTAKYESPRGISLDCIPMKKSLTPTQRYITKVSRVGRAKRAPPSWSIHLVGLASLDPPYAYAPFSHPQGARSGLHNS